LLPAVDSHRTGARILRWALGGAIAVLLGAGLLKVFPGALPGEASAPPSHPAPQVAATSTWNATVFTTDRLITVTLEVDPNQTGINSFTVKLVAMSTGRVLTHASVFLFITMLDMKMATTSVLMHPDGGGQFHGRGELLMGGDWGIRLLIRTTDQRLHEARIQLLTPA
jgi:YtkA-like protein